MRLVLQRKWATSDSTFGELSIDDKFECYVCEDVVRAPGVKVPGQTAIPAGEYRVVIDMSTRFKKLMPHILDVPGFEGIRIHCGNTDADTEGCLLLGRTKEADSIGESRLAFDAFFTKLQAAKEATIQVLDVPVVKKSESEGQVLTQERTDSRVDLLKSLIAIIASFLGNVFPQPRQDRKSVV
jgi:hypothetical protein